MPDQMDLQQNNSSPRKVRILIVDDIPQVRRELKTVLLMASKDAFPGLEVIGEATNGMEAIDQSTQLYPDVVLMDLEMPVADGYTATHAIKATHPSIGVIVLSIHSDENSRRKAALAGADAFIEKGSPINELLRAIRGFERAS